MEARQNNTFQNRRCGRKITFHFNVVKKLSKMNDAFTAETVFFRHRCCKEKKKGANSHSMKIAYNFKGDSNVSEVVRAEIC